MKWDKTKENSQNVHDYIF